jgi:hypothetical protein
VSPGRVVCLLLLAAALTVGVPAAAAADPLLPPPLPPPPTPVAPPAPDAKAGDQLERSFEQSLVPLDPSMSRYPVSRYHVFYDEGGNNLLTKTVANVSRGQGAIGLATEFAFQVSGFLIALAVALLTWGFTFKVAAAFAEPAAKIAEAYQTQLIGPLNLLQLAGLLLAIYVAWHGIRGRTQRAVGELLVSLTIITLATVVVPQGLLNWTMNAASGTSGTILVVGTGGDPNSVPAPSTTSGTGYARDDFAPYFRAYGRTLVEQFVAVPSARLSWGAIPKGACAKAMDRILTQGYDAADDRARQVMADAGPDCRRHADFAAHPSIWRLLGALFNALTALMVLLVAGVLTGILIAGQVSLALLVIFTRPALLLGVVPWGWARALFHRWATGFPKFLIMVVALSGLLVGFTITARAVAVASESWPEAVRWLVMVVLPVLGIGYAFKARKKAEHAGRELRHRLENAPIGGSHGANWIPIAEAGLAGAVAGNLLDGWREARRTGHDVREGLFGSRRRDGWLLGRRPHELAGAAAAAGVTGHHASPPAALNAGGEAAGQVADGAAPAARSPASDPRAAAEADAQTRGLRVAPGQVPASLAAQAPRSLADMVPRNRGDEVRTGPRQSEPASAERTSQAGQPAGAAGLLGPDGRPLRPTGATTQVAPQTATAAAATAAATTGATPAGQPAGAPQRGRPAAARGTPPAGTRSAARQQPPPSSIAARARTSKAARLLRGTGRVAHGVGATAFNLSFDLPRTGAETLGRASAHAERLRDGVRGVLSQADEAKIRWAIENHPRGLAGVYQRAKRDTQRSRP